MILLRIEYDAPSSLCCLYADKNMIYSSLVEDNCIHKAVELCLENSNYKYDGMKRFIVFLRWDNADTKANLVKCVGNDSTIPVDNRMTNDNIIRYITSTRVFGERPINSVAYTIGYGNDATNVHYSLDKKHIHFLYEY